MSDYLRAPAGPAKADLPDGPADRWSREATTPSTSMSAAAERRVTRKRSWRRSATTLLLTLAVLETAVWIGWSISRLDTEQRSRASGAAIAANAASIARPIPVAEPEKMPQWVNDSATPVRAPQAEETSKSPNASVQTTAEEANRRGALSPQNAASPHVAETAGGIAAAQPGNAGAAPTLAAAGVSDVEQRIAKAQVASQSPAGSPSDVTASQDSSASGHAGAKTPRAAPDGLAACLAARPPALQLPPDEVARLIEGGEAFMAQDRVSAARQMFWRAAEACDQHAAFALATTYDPVMLRKRGLTLATPDVSIARTWYEKAETLGSTEASQQLERLSRQNR